MKYTRLVVANLFRKKTRTALTLGSFAVALFLYGLLFILHSAFSQGVSVAGADRLVVVNRVSIIQPLPLAYRDRLLRVPGVAHATFASWFGGVYQDERNFFPQFAIDSQGYRQMYPEFVVSDDDWRAFLTDKEGAIVGEKLAQKFGWKVGDRIPVRGTIFPGNWEFNIRGIYRGQRVQDDTMQFWFRWDYLDERTAGRKGIVGWYTVRVENPDDATTIARAIDDRFANSPFETKTDTEKAFAAGWVKQMGNIQLLMMTVGSVVFFTLLLVTGNTMAIAVRERTRELAVLKAVGFSDGFVLGMVIVESVLVALVGGGIGLGLAKLLSLRGDPTGGLLPFFYLSSNAVLLGIALTTSVGVLAGFLPALSAGRLRVVDALRRV